MVERYRTDINAFWKQTVVFFWLVLKGEEELLSLSAASFLSVLLRHHFHAFRVLFEWKPSTASSNADIGTRIGTHIGTRSNSSHTAFEQANFLKRKDEKIVNVYTFSSPNQPSNQQEHIIAIRGNPQICPISLAYRFPHWRAVTSTRPHSIGHWLNTPFASWWQVVVVWSTSSGESARTYSPLNWLHSKSFRSFRFGFIFNQKLPLNLPGFMSCRTRLLASGCSI